MWMCSVINSFVKVIQQMNSKVIKTQDMLMVTWNVFILKAYVCALEVMNKCATCSKNSDIFSWCMSGINHQHDLDASQPPNSISEYVRNEVNNQTSVVLTWKLEKTLIIISLYKHEEKLGYKYRFANEWRQRRNESVLA